MSSTLEASVFFGKIYSEILHSIKNTGNNLTLKQMFDISEKLIVGQPDAIFGVSQISWESSSWKQLSLVNDEEVISLSHAKVHVFSDSVLCLGKGESEPNIQYCLGTTVGMVQRFITMQKIGHNRRRTDAIRVEHFPRILNIGAHPRSPKVHGQDGRTRTFPSTNYLHVDVQWHHMEK